MNDKKPNDNGNDEEVTRIGWKDISIVVVVIVIIVAVIGFIDSKTPADSQWLNTINAIRTEPVIEIPQTPPEPEITLDSFDDFGITFDEFVQEYNSLIIDGKVNPYPIKFLGVPLDEENGKTEAHRMLPLNSYNTVFYREKEDEGITFLFSPDCVWCDDAISVHIKTKGEKHTVSRIDVGGDYSATSKYFYRTAEFQMEVFKLMANILLERAKKRGVVKSDISYTNSEIEKCKRELFPRVFRFYSIYLSFDVKKGVETGVVHSNY